MLSYVGIATTSLGGGLTIILISLLLLADVATPAMASEAAGSQKESPSDASERAIANHLGIFLTRPNRREEYERIERDGDRLEIWFLRPVPRGARETTWCDGFRWLLTGRLDGADGVGALFSAEPTLSEVSLVFYDIETAVTADARGWYTQSRKPVPLARFTVSRGRAAMLDSAVLRETLKGPGCAKLGTTLVDAFWSP